MSLKTKNKPVQPTAPGDHGFLGVPYFKTHLMMDKRWEPNSLTNQFKCMADVLGNLKLEFILERFSVGLESEFVTLSLSL